MTTLTPEQRQAIERAGGEPVPVEDPETNRAYYLVGREVVEQLWDLMRRRPVGELVIPEGIIRSKAGFLKDLAELMRLKSRKVQWAAYHGDERVGLGATETELYQLCAQRGLKEEEFYVGQIGPQPPEVEEIEGGGHDLDFDEP